MKIDLFYYVKMKFMEIYEEASPEEKSLMIKFRKNIYKFLAFIPYSSKSILSSNNIDKFKFKLNIEKLKKKLSKIYNKEDILIELINIIYEIYDGDTKSWKIIPIISKDKSYILDRFIDVYEFLDCTMKFVTGLNRIMYIKHYVDEIHDELVEYTESFDSNMSKYEKLIRCLYRLTENYILDDEKDTFKKEAMIKRYKELNANNKEGKNNEKCC